MSPRVLTDAEVEYLDRNLGQSGAMLTDNISCADFIYSLREARAAARTMLGWHESAYGVGDDIAVRMRRALGERP